MGVLCIVEEIHVVLDTTRDKFCPFSNVSYEGLQHEGCLYLEERTRAEKAQYLRLECAERLLYTLTNSLIHNIQHRYNTYLEQLHNNYIDLEHPTEQEKEIAALLATLRVEPKPQSGTTDDVSLMRMAETRSENVQFSDQHDPYLYDVNGAVDPTRRLMDTNDASLEHFFSRPLKIHEAEWNVGTSLYFQIDPWSLYMENARVINRITTYNLLRSILRLKIIINGNGFQYGRAIASYLPLEQFDDLSSNVALIHQDLVQASQQPHVFLNPTTSTGGEMKLPFFYHKNYLHIEDSDWGELGNLTVRSLNDLKHANGASDRVTISVFAWIEDVSMAVLTSVDPDTLTPQSGSANEVEEANKKGFISGPATAIKNAANTLKVIPPIAPFAAATEVVAGATAEVAKHFGYCRPPITKAPEPFRPNPVSALANATVPDVVNKLTVDDKQELSIDPRIAGIGNTDALNIKEIARRESYVTSFTWTMGTTPETLLWNSRVTPVTWAETLLTPKSYHFPACCMAALPFTYWTGSINFRFQIVSSAFHKGRIKVVYDPNFLSTNEYNTNYLEVIDISEKSDFTITIGNGQNFSLLEHANPGPDSVTEVYSTTPFASKAPGNGVVGVYVVNELTTPNSTVNNDIEVNVFVSAGDDFEVFVPDDKFQRFVAKPQSGTSDTVPESFGTDEPDAPQQEQSNNIGPGMTNHEMLGRVYTGESIQSFRTMLKRYNQHAAITPDVDGEAEIYGRRPAFPYLRGNVTGAVDQAALATYNYCNTVMLHWVTWAFSGWRGSIRWKMIPRYLNDTNVSVYIQRVPNLDFGFRRTHNTATIGYNDNSAARSSVIQTSLGGFYDNPVPSGVRGAAYTISDVNPIVEFESPFYSSYRFYPGKREDHTTILQYSEGFDYFMNGVTSKKQVIDFWCAAGEDFQCYFFTGLPRLYYEALPPTLI